MRSRLEILWLNGHRSLIRKKKPRHGRPRRKKLLHLSLRSGKGIFQLMLKVQLKLKWKVEIKIWSLLLWTI